MTELPQVLTIVAMKTQKAMKTILSKILKMKERAQLTILKTKERAPPVQIPKMITMKQTRTFKIPTIVNPTATDHLPLPT